ncbi:MAG: hypothetical protein LC620_06540, partial [Halobacteriales archaeon]|nr:hypothetical protein [Halobacteriales archaeon]
MGLRVAISTQTPLLKPVPEVAAARGSGQSLEGLYRLTPGGVCRMVLPTVRQWHASGFLSQAHWFALQPDVPTIRGYDGMPLALHHLSLPPEQLAAYARTKERLWADIHGLAAPAWRAADFRFYARYNWFTADAILEHGAGLDVAYIHDFQLLQVGGLLGLAAPAVLRWHVPFVPRLIPERTRRFLVDAMEAFDTVIVSTRRELEGLVDSGFHGRARQAYPHIDAADWPRTGERERAELEGLWGLRRDDPLILVVARMDPMKRQDLAIQALALLR